MIRKMIGVASELRKRDNFDSLMGLLMGLESQPIFRLAKTWEFVQSSPGYEDIYKRFRSLKTLMRSQKGFSAYRMALVNGEEQMIPYL
jgi:hypothetical protein